MTSSSPLKPEDQINDTFVKYDTRLFLRGKNLLEYDKQIIMQVLNYCNEIIPVENTKKKNISRVLNKLLSEKDISFDKMMKKLNCETPECLMAYFLETYGGNNQSDLLIRCMNTFGRVLPLQSSNEWFDNYRLNAYGNVLNIIMYSNYDSPEVYTINEIPKQINQNVELDFDKIENLLVGSLRKLIITHSIYPNNSNYSDRKLTSKDVCDECYLHYPMFFGGAHGCDCFDMPISLSVHEIKQMLLRYPSARIGYILNTSTYASRRGQHWVTLEFTNGSVKLICSVGHNFDIFDDGGKLKRTIISEGFGMQYNFRTIQKDSYNCGLYSVLSLYMLLCYGDIECAIDHIGINGANTGSNVDKIRSKIVGTL